MKKEIYPKIVLFWNNDSEELTVYNKTIAEAIDIAVFFGYKRSTWYAPWRYFSVVSASSLLDFLTNGII